MALSIKPALPSGNIRVKSAMLCTWEDTHVHRVSKRLGLIGARVSADQAHTIFDSMVPGEWAYPLHVGLIRHGRRVCHAQRPACERCPLRLECAYYPDLQKET